MSGMGAQIVVEGSIGESIAKTWRPETPTKVASGSSESDALDRIGTRSVVKRGRPSSTRAIRPTASTKS